MLWFRLEEKEVLLTGPGRISVQQDVLKREILPKGKAIVQKQNQALQKCELLNMINRIFL
jgi:hypothetical protein